MRPKRGHADLWQKSTYAGVVRSEVFYLQTRSVNVKADHDDVLAGTYFEILCATSVFSVSPWWMLPGFSTTEAQRTQRWHRELKLGHYSML